MPRFGAVVEKVELPLSLVVSSRGETLQLRLEFDGEQIPEARAEAVLADWLAELAWLAQADLEPAGQRGGGTVPGDAAGGRHQGGAQPGSAAGRGPRAGGLWERQCGVPGIWQQTLMDLGVDSVQQLALLAALNEAFAQDRAPLTLQTLKAHPSPAGSIGTGWCAKRRPRYDGDHQA